MVNDNNYCFWSFVYSCVIIVVDSDRNGAGKQRKPFGRRDRKSQRTIKNDHQFVGKPTNVPPFNNTGVSRFPFIDVLFSRDYFFQKMEIKTEEDEVDEGVSPKEIAFTHSLNAKWSSPRVKTKLKSSYSFSKCYAK